MQQVKKSNINQLTNQSSHKLILAINRLTAYVQSPTIEYWNTGIEY